MPRDFSGARAELGKELMENSQNDINIGRYIILPLYTTFLLIFAFSDLWEGLVSILEEHNVVQSGSVLSTILVASCYFFYHLTNEGLTFLLLQHGVGTGSTARVATFGSLWGLVAAAVVALNFSVNQQSVTYIVIMSTFEVSLILFYGWVWLAPASIMFRRPAAVGYAQFWLLWHLIILVSSLLTWNHVEAGYCFSLVFDWMLCSSLKPFVVYRALLADTLYWRGLFREDADEKKYGSSVRHPLLGTTLRGDTATSLALGLDGLARAKVPVLNFAFLQLEGRRVGDGVLGAGSSARVFRGKYKGEPVAVKMIYCVELTPDEIARFVGEAARLNELVGHPNIVTLIGVCVRPPALCLVLELCEYGSLFDVLYRQKDATVVKEKDSQREKKDRDKAKLLESKEKDSEKEKERDAKKEAEKAKAEKEKAEREKQAREEEAKQPRIELNWTNRLLMAWQCAKAIACIHAHHPPLLHLDLKSSNFLLARVLGREGCEFEVKLADLELSMTTEAALSGREVVIPETLNWTAPEVLGARTKSGVSVRISPKTDCYGLGMVLFEILCRKIPFESPRPHMNLADEARSRSMTIKEVCLGSLRPEIPAGTDPEYAQLMRELWAADPMQRPTAQLVQQRLFDMLVSLSQSDRESKGKGRMPRNPPLQRFLEAENEIQRQHALMHKVSGTADEFVSTLPQGRVSDSKEELPKVRLFTEGQYPSPAPTPTPDHTAINRV